MNADIPIVEIRSNSLYAMTVEDVSEVACRLHLGEVIQYTKLQLRRDLLVKPKAVSHIPQVVENLGLKLGTPIAGAPPREMLRRELREIRAKTFEKIWRQDSVEAKFFALGLYLGVPNNSFNTSEWLKSAAEILQPVSVQTRRALLNRITNEGQRRLLEERLREPGMSPGKFRESFGMSTDRIERHTQRAIVDLTKFIHVELVRNYIGAKGQGMIPRP